MSVSVRRARFEDVQAMQECNVRNLPEGACTDGGEKAAAAAVQQ